MTHGFHQVGQPMQAPARADRSGLAKAGEVLLLVGWIMRAVSVLFVVLYLIVFSPIFRVMFEGVAGNDVPADSVGFAVLMLVMLGLMVLLLIASLVVGIVAWNKARAGQYRTPGILGIVASMLPPVDIVYLLGGIFLLVCDEAKEEQAMTRRRADQW